jgi:hypothetical protein
MRLADGEREREKKEIDRFEASESRRMRCKESK